MVGSVGGAFEVGFQILIVNGIVPVIHAFFGNEFVEVADRRKSVVRKSADICVPCNSKACVQFNKRLVQQCAQAVVHSGNVQPEKGFKGFEVYRKVAYSVVGIIVIVPRCRAHLQRIDKTAPAAGNVYPVALHVLVAAHFLVLALRVDYDHLRSAGIFGGCNVLRGGGFTCAGAADYRDVGVCAALFAFPEVKQNYSSAAVLSEIKACPIVKTGGRKRKSSDER